MKLFVVLFVGLLSVVLFLYAPGLHGDFEFDDSANIIDNNSLHITALDLKQLRAAAVSGDAGPTGRPLALISFALNIYFFGMQPFYFKLINVLIHLCNIVLVAGLSSLILRRWYSLSARSGALAGLAVAALWGVHPINLTSILYVVQRMTSLSALFGFLAIYLYVRWRSKPSTEQLS
ncbi:tetratricopeptide repeat protein, partial [Pseudomonas nicosulfuronedens]